MAKQFVPGGLNVEYFKSEDSWFFGRYQGKKLSSGVDSVINFNWENGSPQTNLPSDNFEIVWRGKITVPTTGEYTFFADVDDGVRLNINSQNVINNWIDGAIERQGKITLEAGKLYEFSMEMYENLGSAKAKLSYSGPGIQKQIVPASQFYYALDLPDVEVIGTNIIEGNFFTDKNREVDAFTIKLSAPLSQIILVDYQIKNGTGIDSFDYELSGDTRSSGRLRFEPGETIKKLPLYLKVDNSIESNEIVNLTITQAKTQNGINLLYPVNPVAFTIINDDVPSLEVGYIKIAEGDSGTRTVAYNVRLSDPFAEAIFVDYALTTDSSSLNKAIFPDDFTTPTGSLTGELRFNPGEINKLVEVIIKGDIIVEPDEAIALILSNAKTASGNLIKIDKNQSLLEITNDDRKLLQIVGGNTNEGNTNRNVIAFSINLPSPQSNTVIVQYYIDKNGGTASYSEDYYLNAQVVAESGSRLFGEVSFNPGETSKTVELRIIGDYKEENNETVVLGINTAYERTSTSFIPGSFALPEPVTFTIKDDDSNITLQVDSLQITEGNEGKKTVTFTVTRSGKELETVSVDYILADGTATNASDYVAKSGSLTGTLTFNRQEFSKQIELEIIGDRVFEADETVNIILSNARATNNFPVTLKNAQGVLTIANDDLDHGITINDIRVYEGTDKPNQAVFTVSLNKPSTQVIKVNYRLEQLSSVPFPLNVAGEDVDYRPTSGTLTFQPGETSKNISVDTIADDIPEAATQKLVNLVLSNAENARIDKNSGQLLIIEDEPIIQIKAIKSPTEQVMSGVTYETADATTLQSTIKSNFGLVAASKGNLYTKLSVKEDGEYTFFIEGKQEVRFWVGDRLLIDQKNTSASPQEYSATIQLKANQFYDLRLEYINANNDSRAPQVKWQSPSFSKQNIPENQLYATDASGYLSNVGYIDVETPAPVTIARGFWINYNVSGSAIRGLDYQNSQYRQVSNDPKTQENGIIIPQGQTKGRLYFSVTPDALAEGNETIKVDILTTYTLGKPDYLILNPNPSDTKNPFLEQYSTELNITDSNKYSIGILVLDADEQIISNANLLSIVDKKATVKVKLSSQPNNQVTVKLTYPNFEQTLSFDSTNWDKAQKINLINIPTEKPGNLPGEIISLTSLDISYKSPAATNDTSDTNYKFERSINLPFSTKPVLRVKEGEPLPTPTFDNAPVSLQPPQILEKLQVKAIADVREDVGLPVQFAIQLAQPAPIGGLTLRYHLSGSALAGDDYTDPQVKEINIPAGVTTAALGVVPIADSNPEIDETIQLNVIGIAGLWGAYYSDRNFTNLKFTRIDNQLNFNWGNIPPDISLNSNNYSIRWRGNLTVPSNGEYTFYLKSGGSAKLVINGQVVVNNSEPGFADNSGKITLENGKQYAIVVEYSKANEGLLELSWSGAGIEKNLLPTSQFSLPQTGLNGKYKDGFLSRFSDWQDIERQDQNINFDFGDRSPASRNGSPNSGGFSIDWQGQLEAPATGEYRLYVVTDKDGANLYLDGKLLIDKRNNTSENEFSTTVTLSQYQRYNLNLQYFSGNYDNKPAKVQLMWEGPGISKQVIPTLYLSPKQDFQPQATAKILNDDFTGIEIVNVIETADGNNKIISYSSSLTPLVTSENRLSESIAVRLTAKPTTNVTLELTDINYREGAFSTNSLTFTPDNWNQYQILSVTGLDDNLPDGDISYQVTATTTVKDNNSPYRNSLVTFTVTNLDNETVIAKDEAQVINETQGKNPTIVDSSLPLATLSLVSPSNNSVDEDSNTSIRYRVQLDKPAITDTILYFSTNNSTTDQNDITPLNGFLIPSFQQHTNAQETIEAVQIFDSPVQKINVSSRSTPSLVDIDSDGDLDLVITSDDKEIKLYENTGSSGKAIFKLIPDKSVLNPFNIFNTSNSKTAINITFSDYNLDRKVDGIVGINGGLGYLQNIAKSGNFAYTYTKSDFDKIPIHINGSSSYYSIKNPVAADSISSISGEPTSNYFATVDKNLWLLSGSNGFYNGLYEIKNVGEDVRPAVFDWDRDGDLDLFIGKPDGTIDYYRNDSEIKRDDRDRQYWNGKFTLNSAQNPLAGVDVGNYAKPVFADINNDGQPEAIIGADDGKLYYFEGFAGVKIPTGQQAVEFDLKAKPDKIDEPDETLVLSLNKNIGYRLADTSNSVSVNIKDDDQPGVDIKAIGKYDQRTNSFGVGSYTVEGAANTVLEDGYLRLDVKLTSKPNAPVTVYLGSNKASEALLRRITSDSQKLANPTDLVSLVFTPDNWDTVQQVQVVSVDDRIADGDVNYQIITTIVSDDFAYRDLKPNPLSFINKDNGDTPGVIINPLASLAEGRSGTVGINLNSQPTSNVIVTVTPTDEQLQLFGKGIFDPVSVTFTPENWNIPQLVQFTANDDNLPEPLVTSGLEFSVESQDTKYNALSIPSAQVAILDNDVPTISLQSGLSGSELSSTPGYFLINLNAPTAASTGIEINYEIIDSSTATNGTDYQPIAQTGKLRIAPGESLGTLNFVPIDDRAIEAEQETVTVRLLPGEGYQLNPEAVTATINIQDDDKPGIQVLQPGSYTFIEEGGTAQIFVSLLSEPTEPVTITLNAPTIYQEKYQLGFGTEANPPQTKTLVFSKDNWYILQPVTIKAIEDSIIEDEKPYQLASVNFKVASNDPNYQNFNIDPVEVRISDRLVNLPAQAKGLPDSFDVVNRAMSELSVGALGKLEGKMPNIIDWLKEKLGPTLATQANPTPQAQKRSIQAALNSIEIGGKKLFADVEPIVKTIIDPDGTSLTQIELSKKINLFGFDMPKDLGFPALGIGFDGKVTADFEISLRLTYGNAGIKQKLASAVTGALLPVSVPFFIDAERTKAEVKVTLGLDDKFKGKGNLGPVRLDLANNPENPSKVEIAADISLKDLDNTAGIVFFDGNNNGRFDNGEPWASKKESGRYYTTPQSDKTLTPYALVPKDDDTIETINSQSVEISGQQAAIASSPDKANDSFDKNKNGVYDDAKNQRLEGIYRKSSDGSLYYFDSNRNHKLDDYEPYTNKKDLFDKIFKLASKPSGSNKTIYFVDFNNDGQTINNGAIVSKQLDKNNNNQLDADIDAGGEGRIVNGAGIAFTDINKNQRLDEGEPFVNSQYDLFHINESQIEYLDLDSNTSPGAIDPIVRDVEIEENGQKIKYRYLDFNRNGQYDSFEAKGKKNEGSYDIVIRDRVQHYFFDDNANSKLDPGEPYVIESIERTIDQNEGDNKIKYRFLDFNLNGKIDINEPSAKVDNSEPLSVHAKSDFYLDINGNSVRDFNEPQTFTNYYEDINQNGIRDTYAPFTIEPLARKIIIDQKETFYIDRNNNNSREREESEIPSPARVDFVDFNLNKEKDTFESSIVDGKFILSERKNSQGKTYFDFNNTGIFDGNDIFTTNQWTFNTPFKLLEYPGGNQTNILYLDKNGNNKFDVYGGEQVYSGLDTNNNRILDGQEAFTFPDRDGFFIDLNGNQTLDNGEPNAITVDDVRFLDLNRNGKREESEPIAKDGKFTLPETKTTFIDYDRNQQLTNNSSVNEFKVIVNKNGSRYLDLNNNNQSDPGEPTAASRDNPLLFPQTSIVTIRDNLFNSNGIFIDLDGNRQQDPEDPFIRITADANGRSVRYVDLNGDGKLNTINLDLETGKTAADRDITTIYLEPYSYQDNTFDLTALEKVKKQNPSSEIVTYEDDYGRLNLSEVYKLFKDKDYQFGDIVQYGLSGQAQLGLKAKTSIEGNPAFPALGFDLNLNYPIFNYGNKQDVSANGLNVQLNNIQLDLGTFISDFLKPAFKTVDEIVTPIKPIIRFLNADTKIFSYLGIANQFDVNNDGQVSILEAAKIVIPLAYLNKPEAEKKKALERVDTAIKYAKTLNDIVDIIDIINKTPSNQPIILDFGSYNLTGVQATNTTNTSPTGSGTTSGQNLNSIVQKTRIPEDTTQQAKKSNQSSLIQKLQLLQGLELPLLTDPSRVVQLLLSGGNPNAPAIDFVKYTLPSLDLSFDLQKEIPIYPPGVGLIKGVLQGAVGVTTDLRFGFDSYGLQQWKNANYDLSKAYLVLDGFYLDDLDNSGKDKDEVVVKSTLAAGLAGSAVVAKGIIKGGLEGRFGLDVEDVGEKTGTSDGKIRGSEVWDRISNPLDLFELSGAIDVFLNAEIKVGVDVGVVEHMITVWQKDLARQKIAEFKLDSGKGFRGALNGRTVDGYIIGGHVFLDGNLNGIADADEPATITEIDGKYTLQIDADYLDSIDVNDNGEIEPNEGRIVVIGGYDSQSNKTFDGFMTAPFGSIVVTPLTSLVESISRQNITDIQTAQKQILLGFGFDENSIVDIELLNDDPLGEVRQDYDDLIDELYELGFDFDIDGTEEEFSQAIQESEDYSDIQQEVTKILENTNVFLIGLQVQVIVEQVSAFTGQAGNQVIDQLAKLIVEYNNNGQIVDFLQSDVINFLIQQVQKSVGVNLTSDDLLLISTASGVISAAIAALTPSSPTITAFDEALDIAVEIPIVSEYIERLLTDLKTGEISVDELVAEFYTNQGLARVIEEIDITNYAPPIVESKTITINEDSEYIFKLTDIETTDLDTPELDNPFNSLLITEIPIFGSLLFDGQEIAEGDEISKADIAAGKLKFVPIPNGYGDNYGSIGFRIGDVEDYSEEAFFTINVTAINDLPVLAKNQKLTLNIGTSKTITSELLQVTDVEDIHASLIYAIASLPEDGILQLNGQILAVNATFTQADIDNGLLTYTHKGNSFGRDKFTFFVTDTLGSKLDTTEFNIHIAPAAGIQGNQNHIFAVGTTTDIFELVFSKNINDVSGIDELAVFTVDDEQGSIEGILPHQPEYLAAAISRARSIFSALKDHQFDINGERHLQFNADDLFAFFLVADGSLDRVKASLKSGQIPNNVLFALPNRGDFDSYATVSQTNSNQLSLAWEDSPGGGDRDFNDLTLNIQLANQPRQASPVIQTDSELLDLGDITGTVNADFVVNSEAVFDNVYGFYTVDNLDGQIGDLKPGDAGYAQVALSRQVLAGSNRTPQHQAQLTGGTILAPFLIANGTVDQFLSRNPNNNAQEGQAPMAYFAFMGANPDKIDHFRTLGNNFFGVEDLFGGGDKDFNDAVLRVNFSGY